MEQKKLLVIGIVAMISTITFATENVNTESYQYYSQFGQDKFFHETFFTNKRNGIFVDIGAADGITYSNTYFFEKYLDWRGICIEPVPRMFQYLQKNRSSHCIQGCIADFHGPSKFAVKGLYSGLVHTLNPKDVFGRTILHQLKTGECSTIDVPCFLLDEILDCYNIRHIDLLTIDTEGSEYDILKTVDFKKIIIDCIVVEVNVPDDMRIKDLLESNGYTFVKREYVDEYYVRNDFIRQKRDSSYTPEMITAIHENPFLENLIE